MGLAQDLGAVMDAKFTVNVFNVGANGVFADGEFIADGSVREAFGEGVEDVPFAGGELFWTNFNGGECVLVLGKGIKNF